MHITQIFIDFLHSIAAQVPLPLFTVLAAFIEEVIAPIPSPLVMTLSGSLAASQGHPFTFLLFLALIGALSKTVGSWVVYLVSDKAEDVIIDKFGKFLGVSHKDTEGFGKYLNKGKRDDLVLFLLRAVPIIPTAPVSVVCGLLKVNIRTYLVSTFLGTIVRNMIYLYFGFVSVGALESLNSNLDSLEKYGYLILFFLMFGMVIWFYSKRRSGKGMGFLDRFKS
jgi:membrane protein DedA with SNARE-associated domain